MRVNPFCPGSSPPQRYIVGRARQLEHVDRLVYQLNSGKRHAPIGFLSPPGLGKTSLLKDIAHRLRQRQWICGYSDASPDASSAIHDLLFDARRALPREGIGDKFRARLQEVSVKTGPIGFGLRLGDMEVTTSYAQLFEVLASLGELAKKNSVGMVLLLDEAQVMPQPDIELLFRVIGLLEDLPVALIMASLPCLPDRDSSKSRAVFSLVRVLLGRGIAGRGGGLVRSSGFRRCSWLLRVCGKG